MNHILFDKLCQPNFSHLSCILSPPGAPRCRPRHAGADTRRRIRLAPSGARVPIFDAQIHFSRDAAERSSPKLSPFWGGVEASSIVSRLVVKEPGVGRDGVFVG